MKKSLNLLRCATIFYADGKIERVFRKYDDRGNRMHTYQDCSRDIFDGCWFLGADCKDVDSFEPTSERYDVASDIADCCWQDGDEVKFVLVVDEYRPYKHGRLSKKESDMTTIRQRFWINGRYISNAESPQII